MQHLAVAADRGGMSHSPSLRPLLLLSGLSLASACHESVVPPKQQDSATDGAGIFAEDNAETETGTETETSGYQPAPPNPADFCTLNPEGSDTWERFTCSGEMSVSMVFEYHGDPNLPINSHVPCVDLSDGQATEPSYVYTCFVMAHQPFGPDISNKYAGEIDACCHAGSPTDFVEAFCAIDAVEELCLGSVNVLNDLRKKIPQIGAGAELYDQLTNLNKFIATKQAQTSCAKELAKELLADEGTPKWSPNVEEPAVGWPWIRALDLNILDFDLDDPAATGTFCGEALALDTIACQLHGLVEIDGPATSASASVTGQATLGSRKCAAEGCAVQLSGLQLDVADLQIGPWRFGEIHASLSVPADGRLIGSAFRIPAREVKVEAEFRTSDETGALTGEAITVSLSADNELAGSLTDGGLWLGELVVTSWPLEIRLVELSGTCE